MELKIDRKIITKVYPPRKKGSHKGDFGKLLIIGGSERFTGAPALSALAALRAGVDIAVVAAPERAADVIASFSPNIITEQLPGNHISMRHVKHLLGFAENFTAVAIGSGLGREKETLRAAKAVIRRLKIPCVIDADAIHSLAGVKKLSKEFVLTPHAHEFKSLTGAKPKQDLDDRIRLNNRFAKKLGTTITLKGYIDVISNWELSAINDTGNPYMTTGGTGDVLSGVCGALLAKGINPFDAASAAAFITGEAGNKAGGRLKSGLLATDIIEEIPRVVNG